MEEFADTARGADDTGLSAGLAQHEAPRQLLLSESQHLQAAGVN